MLRRIVLSSPPFGVFRCIPTTTTTTHAIGLLRTVCCCYSSTTTSASTTSTAGTTTGGTTIPFSELINLRSKTAIVTGSGSGIGRAIATRLAQAGANVVVADKNEAAAMETKRHLESLGHTAVEAVMVDVTDASQVDRMVHTSLSAFPTIDILVNNAGILPSTPFHLLDLLAWDHVLDTNLKGAFLCTQRVSRQMIAQGSGGSGGSGGGRIVNISSIVARRPSPPGIAHYDASKHGLVGLTRSSALVLAPHGIMVNVVLPGTIDTEGSQRHREELSKSGVRIDLNMVSKRIPSGRQGTPDDVAKTVLFLSSPLCSYITGNEIVVDGGWLLV